MIYDNRAEVRKVFADPEIKKSFLERQYFESIAGGLALVASSVPVVSSTNFSVCSAINFINLLGCPVQTHRNYLE